MEITSQPGARRSYIFTNKLGDYIFLPTSRENFTKYNGFHFGDTVIESIEVLREGELVLPFETHITQNYCEYEYPGIIERLTPHVGKKLVHIDYVTDSPTRIRLFYTGQKPEIVTNANFIPDELHMQRNYPFDQERGDSFTQDVQSDELYEIGNEESFDLVFGDNSMHFEDFLFGETESRLDEAVAWARLTASRMITHFDYGVGIIAGIPWFNIPWVRDELISFKGAVLLNGFFAEGRRILETIFEHVKDGRVPNFFDEKETAYNSIDATPLFIKSIFDYCEVKKEDSLWRANEGKIEEIFERAFGRCDSSSFLLARQKETWMDTLDRSGACVEIQALWYDMLKSAEKYGGDSLKEKCITFMENLKINFEEQFWNGLYLSDRVGDDLFRPNQMFAVLTDLIDLDKKIRIMDQIAEKLITPQGVSTRERGEGFYEKDTGVDSASYHNGDVWPWLTGLASQCEARIGRKERAEKYLKILSDSILLEGALGSICEIKSADSPEPMGCFSQAWSVAKFIEAREELKNRTA